MKDTFSGMHPITNLVFFTDVIAFSMFLMHPVCIVISLVCAFINASYLGGKKTVLFSIKFLIPGIILVALINPLINHRGVTIIEYLPWDNPLTLESVVFGIASAVLLCSAVLWFSCVKKVMTSDKQVYLFGRVTPSFGLVLSMALRFVPRFIEQFKQVSTVQKQFHCNKPSFLQRLKSGVRALSIMITKSLEGAVETSDSMKSRGYGLKGRTAFSAYIFTLRDKITLSFLLAETVFLITVIAVGKLNFRYFPSIKGTLFDGYSFAFYINYTALMLTPFIINVGEGWKWKRSRSKI